MILMGAGATIIDLRMGPMDWCTNGLKRQGNLIDYEKHIKGK